MATNDDIVRQAIVGSPLGRLLGVEPDALDADRARIRLPFRSEVTTAGDLVHGGAIAALVDVAATAAVWTAADLARNPRGTTIGFSLNFLAPARGQDLFAEACVVQMATENAANSATEGMLAIFMFPLLGSFRFLLAQSG